jgi:hypothetical protein
VSESEVFWRSILNDPWNVAGIATTNSSSWPPVNGVSHDTRIWVGKWSSRDFGSDFLYICVYSIESNFLNSSLCFSFSIDTAIFLKEGNDFSVMPVSCHRQSCSPIIPSRIDINMIS